MTYGLPYKGSKNRLAAWIVDMLPEADVLYDVFAGGCAVTHAALLSGKYRKVVANDLNDVPSLFRDALEGKVDRHDWVSREDFERLKDTDPWVAVCYSFGNNLTNYLYNRDIEAYKKAVHEMIYTDTPNGRRLAYRKVVRELLKYLRSKGALTSDDEKFKQPETDHGMRVTAMSENCVGQQKESERCNRIIGISEDSVGQSQEMLNAGRMDYRSLDVEKTDYRSLDVEKTDYRSLDIPDDAVVYCDPPYKGTDGYGTEFDHDAFFDWCRSLAKRGVRVYVSGYEAPDDFVIVGERKHRCNLAATTVSIRMERVFTCRPSKN